MSDDPPKGVELVIARYVDRKIQALDCRIDVAPPSISTHSTIDGVRCNVDQQLNTIPRNLNELAEYYRRLKKEKGELDRYVVRVEQALYDCRARFYRSLKVCGRCLGEGGFGQNGSLRDPWRDCEKCSGRGVLPK